MSRYPHPLKIRVNVYFCTPFWSLFFLNKNQIKGQKKITSKSVNCKQKFCNILELQLYSWKRAQEIQLKIRTQSIKLYHHFWLFFSKHTHPRQWRLRPRMETPPQQNSPQSLLQTSMITTSNTQFPTSLHLPISKAKSFHYWKVATKS